MKLIKIICATNEAERKRYYRWYKKGIFKQVKFEEKQNFGRPKSYYMINLDFFKKEYNNLDSFLEIIKEIKKYLPIAIGLPFSLMRYKYLQISSIYLYSYSEYIHEIQDIFSNFNFVSIHQASKSMIEQKVNYKNLPLLTIEDTILTAIKDAKNMMAAYVLLKTQSDKIDYPLLFKKILFQNINLESFIPLLKNKHPPFLSLYNGITDDSELEHIQKASKSILRIKYDWDSAFNLLKSKFKFIDKIGGDQAG